MTAPSTPIGWLVDHLASLHVWPFPLLGCPRRNVWGAPWRSDAAVAVLDKVGRRATVVWRGESVTIFTALNGNDLLLWRGGPWRDWWIQDMEMLAAMVQTVSNIRASGVYMLHEVDGRTRVRYVETPAERVQTAYAELMKEWAENPGAPPRIDRASDKAKYLCWRCPTRRRCEASDLESGDTGDWLK